MNKSLLMGLGAVLAVVGAVWTFQGLGYLEGSPMTGSTTWAYLHRPVGASGRFVGSF